MEFVTFLFIAIAITFCIQTAFWFCIFLPLGFISKVIPEKTTIDTTLLICAKNEINNIKNHISHWLAQLSQNSKIVIMDDFSSDNTWPFLINLKNKHPNLDVHKVKSNRLGKKQALMEGLSHCRHKYLLLTDADCYPQSQKWMYTMVNYANHYKKDIILGYCPYAYDNQSLLSKWMHFESWHTGLLYLGLAQAGLPYMGVGRNLLYRREILNKATFEKHQKYVSGDDDLTINAIANKENTAICIAPEALVISKVSNSWRSYWHQKCRHYSVASAYNNASKRILMLYHMTFIMFYALIIFIMFSSAWKIALLFITMRWLIQGTMSFIIKNTLKAEFRWYLYPFWDICILLSYLIFLPIVLYPKNPNNWNSHDS